MSQTQPTELSAHVGHVVFGRDAGVLTGANCVLLGGQAKRVVAKRVEHIETGLAFVAGVDIGTDVAKRMSDVKTRS